jgi:hypothetical protein
VRASTSPFGVPTTGLLVLPLDRRLEPYTPGRRGRGKRHRENWKWKVVVGGLAAGRAEDFFFEVSET